MAAFKFDMVSFQLILFVFLSCFFAAGCAAINHFDTVRERQAIMMKSFVNEEINPCDDFYKYACGNWAKQQHIQKTDLQFGVVNVVEAKVNKFFQEAILYNNYTSESRINHISKIIKISEIETIRKYYTQCREQKGRKYEPYISALNIPGGWPALNSSWTSENFDWLNVIGQLKLMDAESIIDVHVGPHFDNASRNALYIMPPLFPIFQADAFMDEGSNFARSIISDVIKKIFTSFGINETEVSRITKDVLEFEIQLARLYPSSDNDTDVADVSLETLKQHIPEVDFRRLLKIVSEEEFPDSQEVTMVFTPYFVNVAELLNKTSPNVLANYFLYKLTLPIGISGDIDQYCTGEVTKHMGFMLGYIYDLAFNDDRVTADVTEIAESIKRVFVNTVNETDWMDDRTKEEALIKLKNLLFKIGSFKNDTVFQLIKDQFSKLDIASDNYHRNYVQLHSFTVRRTFEKLRELNKRSDTDMNSATVNAYYHSTRNQIEIPNSLLQEPLYEYNFPYSVKFGGLGAILGHEMTHSLDATGREIDSNGAHRDWWSTISDVQYKNRSDCLESQYHRYIANAESINSFKSTYKAKEVNDSLNTARSDTLDENIADNGGLKQAYQAYELWLQDNSLDHETLTQLNFTARQLFFLSYAQFYCEMAKPAIQIINMFTDDHSLSRIRVVGSLSNFDEFSKQFNCPIGSEMNPAKKCKVW